MSYKTGSYVCMTVLKRWARKHTVVGLKISTDRSTHQLWPWPRWPQCCPCLHTCCPWSSPTTGIVCSSIGWEGTSSGWCIAGASYTPHTPSDPGSKMVDTWSSYSKGSEAGPRGNIGPWYRDVYLLHYGTSIYFGKIIFFYLLIHSFFLLLGFFYFLFFVFISPLQWHGWFYLCFDWWW